MQQPVLTPGRRAQKKHQTRAALIRSAMALFADRGFDAVTVSDIAAAGGVSRRSFFRYFASKEAVFFASHEERLIAFEQALAAPSDLPPTDQVIAAVLTIAERYQADRQELVTAHQILQQARGLAAWDQQLDARWEDAISRALTPQLGELHAIVTAGAIIGAVRAGLRRWFAAKASFDLTEFGAQAFAWLSAGLPSTSVAAPEGAAPEAATDAPNPGAG
ncbi:MAG: TetR family transcriptional regulator [Myxococcales bacterium]|nr:TetR family transcriptional regulator [Myxococcales bacterium]